jgi:tRNA A-37 threonylcarbamoyl transferase component Bud32
MLTAFETLFRKHSSHIIDTSSNTIVIAPTNSKFIYKSFGSVIPMSQISQKKEEQFEVNKKRNFSNFNQIHLLQKTHIPTVKTLSISKDNSVIKMTKLNSNLFSNLIEEDKVREEQFVELGVKLAEIHTKLQLLNKEKIRSFEIDERFNSHCAVNFKYKTVGWVKNDDFRKIEDNKLEIAFAKSIKLGLSILEKYKTYLSQDTIIYGDFKPDNMFIDEDGKITFIDPLLSLARRSCDLGKLGSRVLLLNERAFTKHFTNFVSSYQKSTNIKIKEVEISHMMAFDLLNYFSKVLLLHRKGFTIENLYSDQNTYILSNTIPQLFNE